MDPIVALATPWGVGALHVLRASGDSVKELVERFLDKPLLEPRRAYLRQFVAQNVQDQVVAVYYRGPHSYTGEDVVELTCHGNPLIAELILAALVDSGMRPAEPGEFTFRALVNGKMDLAQAEALNDLIQAKSLEAVQAAARELAGGLSSEIADMRNRLLRVLSYLQASVDFPDDVELSNVEPQLAQLSKVLENLLSNARNSDLYRRGMNIVIAGRPNVGKSSLMNALVGMERAIVSHIPGTTRDYLEHYTVLGNMPVNLVDTAGLRVTSDPLEGRGIDLALKKIAEADLVVFLYDAHQGWTDEDEATLDLVKASKVLIAANKADLQEADTQREGAVFISALSGQGLDQLLHKMQQVLGVGEPPRYLLNQRQTGLLNAALNDIKDALLHLKSYPEVAADDIYSALRNLNLITEGDITQDLLGTIFSEFCIGK
ncbi:tRNA uridine-5-carboxymethylaminomethyl(34) synthesis GTPase MnmE [Coprothermobacteraceae bacterium]|nr:tRNA uridine-5-carboxymethylaminomethyl(34) synthesis GTPase MnmE [Coprothermobacteraceae bacterium]